MNALVYISKVLKISDDVLPELKELERYFDNIQIEIDYVNLYFIAQNTSFDCVIGYVQSADEFEVFKNGKKAKFIYFVTNDSALIPSIQQSYPSAKLVATTAQLVKEFTGNQQANVSSTAPTKPVQPAKQSQQQHVPMDNKLHGNPNQEPIRQEATGTEETVEQMDIIPNDLSEDVLAGDSADGTEVEYQENPIHTRTRQIQKNLFSQQQWADHKIIGLWSPIGRVGVSTFALNFALYLAKQRIYTTVLEGLTPKPHLKQTLSRYTKVPKDWISYASTIQEDHEPRNASWIYENVVFLPCVKSDLKYIWNPVLIEAYMTTTKIVDVTLVDIPSGHLEEYSKDALHYVDELWILFDDSYHELMNWKQYIKELEKKLQIPIHLIMSRTYEFSQASKISKEMELPLITSIPAMDELIMHNAYQDIPIYYVEEATEQLNGAYSDIASHLFKKSFNPKTSQLPTGKKRTFLEKLYTSILKA